MSNRLSALLNAWFDEKDSCQWLLASIIETQRSSYRKTGAMMLINSHGKSYGLLSGGCLEADLLGQAKKCWHNNHSTTVCYDMSDEDDIAWQLGIGCGGMVKVLLQPIHRDNNYLDLLTLKAQLDKRQACYYQLNLTAPQSIGIQPSNKVCWHVDEHTLGCIEIKPAPSLVIFGGGIDAQPLVALAKTLGWYVCVVDSRTAYARPAYFQQADVVMNESYQAFHSDQNTAAQLPQANAVVVMHHNIDLDAQALQLVKKLPQLAQATYVGLLGPQHRTARVFTAAELCSSDLPQALANPIGLDLGGDLPESIALAILAQAHAAIEQANGKALGYYHARLQQVNSYVS